MRCFLAVDVSEEIKQNIIRIQNDIKNIDVKVKFVEIDNFHFTLSFLGETNENEVNTLIGKLTRELEDNKSFNITLKGLGYFGTSHNIKNIWIGVNEGEKQFHNLSTSITKHTDKRDSRFSPHVTLCRIKSPQNMNDLIIYVNKMKEREFGSMRVNNIHIKKSILTPDGPIYSNIHTFRLGDTSE